jgi:hypothetical protein
MHVLAATRLRSHRHQRIERAHVLAKKKTSPRFKDKIEHTIHLTKLSSAL